MKKLTAILAIMIIATPAYAGSIQIMDYNGDSWVVGTASGEGTFEIVVDLDTLPDSFTPTNPTHSAYAWKWTGDTVSHNTTGIVVQPDPSEAIAEMERLLVDAYTDSGATYPQIEAMTLLDDYPSIERQLQAGRYQITIDYIRAKIQPVEGIVSDTMVNTFSEYLKISK